MAIGPMRRAVNAALRTATLKPADGATKTLATTYATLIDEAAPKAAYDKALRVLASVVVASEHPEANDAFDKIRKALSAHTVASDLGPKLLATLLALGMAPAARGKDGGGPVAPVASKLDELRARREARANGAASVDTASP